MRPFIVASDDEIDLLILPVGPCPVEPISLRYDVTTETKRITFLKLRAGLDRPYFLLRRQNNVEGDSQLTKGADVGAVDSNSFGTEFPCRKRVSYNTARGWWERGRTLDRLLILHRTYFRLDLCIDDRETLSRGDRD